MARIPRPTLHVGWSSKKVDVESSYERTRETHCITAKGVPSITGTKGAIVVKPMSASWRNVLYLLMVVGRTSAEGKEKSQYLVSVLGGGKEIQR